MRGLGQIAHEARGVEPDAGAEVHDRADVEHAVLVRGLRAHGDEGRLLDRDLVRAPREGRGDGLALQHRAGEGGVQRVVVPGGGDVLLARERHDHAHVPDGARDRVRAGVQVEPGVLGEHAVLAPRDLLRTATEAEVAEGEGVPGRVRERHVEAPALTRDRAVDARLVEHREVLVHARDERVRGEAAGRDGRVGPAHHVAHAHEGQATARRGKHLVTRGRPERLDGVAGRARVQPEVHELPGARDAVPAVARRGRGDDRRHPAREAQGGARAARHDDRLREGDVRRGAERVREAGVALEEAPLEHADVLEAGAVLRGGQARAPDVHVLVLRAEPKLRHRVVRAVGGHDLPRDLVARDRRHDHERAVVHDPDEDRGVAPVRGLALEVVAHDHVRGRARAVAGVHAVRREADGVAVALGAGHAGGRGVAEHREGAGGAVHAHERHARHEREPARGVRRRAAREVGRPGERERLDEHAHGAHIVEGAPQEGARGVAHARVGDGRERHVLARVAHVGDAQALDVLRMLDRGRRGRGRGHADLDLGPATQDVREVRVGRVRGPAVRPGVRGAAVRHRRLGRAVLGVGRGGAVREVRVRHHHRDRVLRHGHVGRVRGPGVRDARVRLDRAVVHRAAVLDGTRVVVRGRVAPVPGVLLEHAGGAEQTKRQTHRVLSHDHAPSEVSHSHLRASNPSRSGEKVPCSWPKNRAPRRAFPVTKRTQPVPMTIPSLSEGPFSHISSILSRGKPGQRL